MEKTCNQTGQKFEIDQRDLDFYKKVSPKFSGNLFEIPPPTLCPEARRQRRLAFRNERFLYHRKCDATGEMIISNFEADRTSPVFSDKKFKVYKHDYWWSDQWDALDYGRDFDFNRPFFEQFAELMVDVPMNQFVNAESENCPYANHCWFCKNCYLSFDVGVCEDTFYSHTVYNAKTCFDCFHCRENCELCYECIDCNKCYNCVFSIQCKNSNNLGFCFDCHGCSDCFMSTNQRNKKYMIYNKQYSKEDYEKIMTDVDLGSQKTIVEMKKRFFDFKVKEGIHHFSNNINVENSTGMFLKDCRNTLDAFSCSEAEDCRYIYDCANPTGKDFYDDDRGGWAELTLESLGNPQPYMSAFLISTGHPKNCYYCFFCHGVESCFGCVGMRNKKFCIFNKQYSEDEYYQLVAKIISKMQNEGDWGEFFPMQISPFCYNETLANDYFPQTEDWAKENCLRWKPKDHKEYRPATSQISDNIKDVDSKICEEVFACEVTGKNYKIVPQELKFYKMLNLPIPRKCPDQRQDERVKIRPGYKLYDRKCDKTGDAIKSAYSPDCPEKVYCEKAYLEVVFGQ